MVSIYLYPHFRQPCRETLLLLAFLIPLLFAILACDAVGNVVGSKPSTSAPRTNNANDYARSCDEKEDAIRDWERDQERKVEDEWIDDKRGIWQTAAKVERIENEAKAMRRELRDNCKANEPGNDCIDADAMEDIRAEYQANENRANQKYVGQRMCLRGMVSGFSKSSINAEVGDDRYFDAVSFSISPRKSSGGRYVDKDWESWMMSKSVGDTVEAECTLHQFWYAGTPTFRNCKKLGD